ncbi:hypothetical protein [Burkholderia sp. AW49-1]|nr:hypothetical protein [Burkholderia vietnamiensis]
MNPNAFRNIPAQRPFASQYNITASSTLADIQSNMVKYQTELLEAAGLVKRQDAAVSSVTFLGALAATFGAIYQKTALILAGAGVGGAGFAVNQHYQLDSQATSYRNAADNIDCVMMASYSVTDDDLELVSATADKDDDRVQAINGKKLVVMRANAVNRRLLDALETASKPSAGSENDWKAYITKLETLSTNADVTVDPDKPALKSFLLSRSLDITGGTAPDAEKAKLEAKAHAALLRVRTMNADLQKCSLSMK